MNEVSRESIGNYNLRASSKPEGKKILIHKEDVQMMVDELEISKVLAEKKLLEFNGDVKAAMKSIMGID